MCTRVDWNSIEPLAQLLLECFLASFVHCQPAEDVCPILLINIIVKEVESQEMGAVSLSLPLPLSLSLFLSLSA